MAKRNLQTYSRFRYGKRSFIYAGDKFRSSGGPYYVGKDEDGKRVRQPMGETGAFAFRKYCELGASKWIEATTDEHQTIIIYVGRKRKSSNVDGLMLRPHKIRPLYEKNHRPKKSKANQLTQKELFVME